MMGKKKRFGIFLVFLVIMTGLFIAGCGGKDGGSKENSDSGSSAVIESTLSLDKTELLLKIDEQKKLNAHYDVDLGKTLTFESADTSIATVDILGNVKGIGEGETTITARYGDAVASCKITVDNQGLVPTLIFDDVSTTELSTCYGEKISFASHIAFDGKTYTDAIMKYTVADPTIGTIVDAEFIAVKGGTTTIIVSATWRTCETITKSFNITVKSLLQIVINDGETDSIELYTTDELMGQSFKVQEPFAVEALLDGKDYTSDVSISVKDETIAEYDEENKAIKAVGEGKTNVVIAFTADDNEVYSKEVPVTVVLPVYSGDDNIYEMDPTMQINEFVAYITDDIVGARDEEGNAIAVDGNVIVGIPLSANEDDCKKITVYTDNAGYELTVISYTKIIKTSEDLDILKLNDVNDLKRGCYVLGANIDYGGKRFTHFKDLLTNTNYKSGTCGFSGTFDGRGYTITNIELGVGGLFGTVNLLADGGIVRLKNFAVTGVKFQSIWNVSTLGVAVVGAETWQRYLDLSNVYVQISDFGQITQGGNGALFRDVIGQWTKMTNVVIDAAGTPSSAQCGSLFAYSINSEGFLNNLNRGCNNVYVISGAPLALQTGNSKPYRVDAGNTDVIPGEAGEDTVFIGRGNDNTKPTLAKLTNVKRYETAEEMQAAQNDYTSFSEEYWTVTTEEGKTVLTWKGRTA